MEVSLLLHHQPISPSFKINPPKLLVSSSPGKRVPVSCCCSEVTPISSDSSLRRSLMGFFLTATAGLYLCDVAMAVSTSRRALRGAKIPESEYTTLPNGLKYYDLKVGSGTKAVKGSRVAPYGFDVGQSENGSVLKGLDLGVEGMRVGGQRLLIVPPELAYGNKGVQEIPPNATLELDIELLAIKQNPFGSSVKLIEG